MEKFWEDSRHGLPPLSGSGEPVGSSVREEDHGGRPHVQGAAEGTGVMRGMRRVVGGRIPDESSDDSKWERGGNTTAMEHPNCRGWALDFQDNLPGEGRPAELPGGGMPRLGGD